MAKIGHYFALSSNLLTTANTEQIYSNVSRSIYAGTIYTQPEKLTLKEHILYH